MSSVFICGALRDPELLNLVLGEAVDVSLTRALDLEGYAVQVGNHPTEIQLVLEETRRAHGFRLDNVSDDALKRLAFYHAVLDQNPQSFDLPNGRMTAFVLGASPLHAQQTWDFEPWNEIHGELTRQVAKEIMQHMDLRDTVEVRSALHGMRLRASARLRGAQEPRKDLQFAGKTDVVSETLSYAKFFALKDYEIQSEQFQGDMSPVQERAVFVGMDCAIVLPYDPVRDRVLLVEQMRMGPLARGDRNAWQIEPVAGHVDPGETPEHAAIREVREEAGLEVKRLESIAACYPSPGASSEFYYMYAAITDLPDDASGIAGVEAEGENIRSHILSFDTLMEMVRRNDITVAPLVACAYWLAVNRDRLRREA